MGAGVDSCESSALFALGFAFANDLNRSPVVWLFFAPDFESDLFSVLVPAEDRGVDRPEALSSDALPLRAGAVSFALGCVATLGFVASFAAGLTAGFDVDAAGGPPFRVLRYAGISSTRLKRLERACLYVGISNRTVYFPPLHGIFICILCGYLVVAGCQQAQVLRFLATDFLLSMYPFHTSTGPGSRLYM